MSPKSPSPVLDSFVDCLRREMSVTAKTTGTKHIKVPKQETASFRDDIMSHLKTNYGIMDASTICDSRMVSFMKQIAIENKITWQNEILTAGGTDTSGIQRMTPGGSIAGAVSIPTRHIHQVIEMVHKSDVKNCIDLMNICLSNLDQSDWKF